MIRNREMVFANGKGTKKQKDNGGKEGKSK